MGQVCNMVMMGDRMKYKADFNEVRKDFHNKTFTVLKVENNKMNIELDDPPDCMLSYLQCNRINEIIDMSRFEFIDD